MLLNRLSSAFAYLVLFYLLVLTACTGHSWSISALRCEYLRSPIHIDVSSPRFTGEYEGSAGGMQPAYEMELADAKEALLQEKPIWTAGWGDRGQSTAVC